MNWKFSAFAALGLAACQPSLPIPTPSHDACKASRYEYLLGQKRAQVEAVTFSQPVRIIPRNAAVALDFQPERINFALNRAHKVVAITCG